MNLDLPGKVKFFKLTKNRSRTPPPLPSTDKKKIIDRTQLLDSRICVYTSSCFFLRQVASFLFFKVLKGDQSKNVDSRKKDNK